MKLDAFPPRLDPVPEVFDAVVHARRSAPDGHGDWTVAVRSRTGQLMARFTLGSREQVLAFAERVVPLGYRMTQYAAAQGEFFDFSFDRRAANEAIEHPRRRSGE